MNCAEKENQAWNWTPRVFHLGYTELSILVVLNIRGFLFGWCQRDNGLSGWRCKRTDKNALLPKEMIQNLMACHYWWW